VRADCPWDKDGNLTGAKSVSVSAAPEAALAAPVHVFRKFASTTADDMGEC
jgi:nitrogenase molybdenum-cofactor synthesis protein NifE